jgi:hypothetical protein
MAIAARSSTARTISGGQIAMIDSIAVKQQNTTETIWRESKLAHPIAESVARLEERIDDLRALAGEAIMTIYVNAERGSMGEHSGMFLKHANAFQRRFEAIEKASEK